MDRAEFDRNDVEQELRINPKAFVAFGIPWSVLGLHSLGSDSGHILIYEPLKEMYRQFGMKSVYYLDDRFKEPFEEMNDPEETGVYPIYSGTYRTINHTKGGMLDNNAMDAHLSGKTCQAGVIFTNKRWFVPAYALQATHHFYHYTIPVYNQPTCCGMEAVEDCLENETQIWRYRTLLMNEAASYELSRRMMWVTSAQRARAKKIMRYYLSPARTKNIIDRGVLIGGGIPPVLRKHQTPDAVVAKRLQTKQKDFQVSYVGRFNSNKQVSRIFDMLHPLFVRHDLKFEVVTTGNMKFSNAFKRFSSPKDAECMVDHIESGGKKGRDYYFSEILPKVQCSLMASLFESHPSVPRELIFVGAPVMMPRNKDWSVATMGERYPFYYDTEAELMATIKRIRDGRITDKEVEDFLWTRNNVDIIQFMDYNAAKMYNMFYYDFCNDVMPRVIDREFSRAEKLFLQAYPTAGEEFLWMDYQKKVSRKGVTFGTRTKDVGRACLWYFLSKYFDVVNPATGLVRRREETYNGEL